MKKEIAEFLQRRITGTENSFRNKKEIWNFNVYGESVILFLMRKYGIEVPTEMQKWIGDSLVSVIWKNNDITYLCDEINDDFIEFLRKLEQRIDERKKHNGKKY